ncbi:MAG: response regulator [Phycisphaerae bacterium]|nr:response regulator [Phycisphaerae bacterium]
MGATMKPDSTEATGQPRCSARADGAETRPRLPTILLVDDESEIRSVMREVLERAGYEVASASRGVEALGLCATRPQPFDLVIADVTMPEMNGRELVRRLQRAAPRTRVLLMSGYADEEPQQPWRRSDQPATRFIAKPFTPDSLLSQVRETLLER